MSSMSMSQRWLRVAPIATMVLAGLIVAATVGNFVLILTMPAAVPSYDATYASGIAPLLPIVATGSIALLLTTNRPENQVGWLLGALALCFAVSGISQDYLYHSLYVPDLPRAPLAPIVLASAALPIPALFIQLGLVFPDGHLLSRRWRSIAWINIACAFISAVTLILDPTAIGDGHRELANPIGLPNGYDFLPAVTFVVGGIALVGLLAAAAVSLVLRFRRANSELRQQLRWFGLGVVVLLVGFVVAVLTASSPAWSTPAPIIASTIAVSALPACIGVAVLKYRLYDIDIVINRALVYGALAAFISAIYVGIVVGIGSLVGGGGRPNLALSIVATAVVAVAFQPVRERVQRIANRLVYGKRATPYEVLSEFSQRVAESYAGDEVLGRMARVLAEGTGAQAAEVWLRGGNLLQRVAVWPDGGAPKEPVAVTGQLMPELPQAERVVAVRHQGELLGALSVSKRKGESLTPIEEKLLSDLAHQAGLVLKNVGLRTELLQRLQDLHASRQRLVMAQDDERRRIENELQEGAQQHLVGLNAKLARADAMLDGDPSSVAAKLQELKADADAALETLRDLARGIYPPLLADRGLAAALNAHVRKATIPITVSAEGVGRYPQDVESTIYFCCLEALQNIQRYAGASAATVSLAQSADELKFEISDDGRGFDLATTKRGSGLQNMADRLDAAGGILSIESSPGHGVILTGTLPSEGARAA